MTEYASKTRRPVPPIASASKTPAPIIRHATASGGQTLDAKTQKTMGARFGHDFSQVRVHTNAPACESAQAMGANAYAVGPDIVFGAGRYQPGTRDGDRLLAHELTHVVQQSAHGAGQAGALSKRADASEQEAESLAAKVLAGQAVQVQHAPTAAVQCFQPPDAEWNNKHDDDVTKAHFRTAETIPGWGNLLSAASGGAALVSSGYNAITGDDKQANSDLAMAEDLGLNAIPWLGNLRAAKQAGNDYTAVEGDNRGIRPQDNPNSSEEWEQGGQGKFNKSVGDLLGEFF